MWQPKAGLSAKEHFTALVGSLLALLVFGLLWSFAATGDTVSLEHPADPGGEPYPSIFFSPEFDYLRAFRRLLYGILDQCMLGARAKKPIGFAITNRHSFASFLYQRCNHKCRHGSVIGTDKQNPGKFAIAVLARYTPDLNAAIARAHVGQWALALRDGDSLFGAELGFLGDAGQPWRCQGLASRDCDGGGGG